MPKANSTEKIRALLDMDRAEIKFLEWYIPYIEKLMKTDPMPRSENYALTPEFLKKQKDRLKVLKRYR